MTATQHMLNIMRSGQDDPELPELWDEIEEERYQIYSDTYQQEVDWIAYLFKDGGMIGLNADITRKYLEYVTRSKMLSVGMNPERIGLEPKTVRVDNPIPWITTWLSSDAVQVAPQEVEVSTYLTGSLDMNVTEVQAKELVNKYSDY